VQGIHHLRMRLFDYTMPCLLPSGRPHRPAFGQSPHLYRGYPALAINPFEHQAILFPCATQAPPMSPYHTPLPYHRPRSAAYVPLGSFASTSTSASMAWQPCYQPDKPLQAGFLHGLLPKHLRHLRSLQLLRSSKVLDLQDYRSISSLTQLTELTINSLDGGTRHRSIAADSFAFLAALGCLQTLDLQLPIKGLPSSIWMLTELKTLTLSGLTDLDLPGEFGQLKGLTKLELIDCGLLTVPPVICECCGVHQAIRLFGSVGSLRCLFFAS
jgi:hypothetical protein